MFYTFEHRGTMKPPKVDAKLETIDVVTRFLVKSDEPLTDKTVSALGKQLDAKLVSTNN